MTNIYEFSSYLGGVARPSQFRVHINFPSILVTDSNEAKHSATFLTKTASLPSYRTEPIEIFYRGRKINEAGEPTFEEWECTIINSSDFRIRKALEEWSNAIGSPDTVYGLTRPETYKGTILVEQLDRAGETLRVYKLFGAFPTATGTIELDYDNGNQVETYTPTFAYDYFTVGGKELLESATSI